MVVPKQRRPAQPSGVQPKAVTKLKAKGQGVVHAHAAKVDILGSGKACETYCRRVVEEGPSAISAAVVTRALSLANIPHSASRRNVIPKDQEEIQASLCGLFVAIDNVSVATYSRRSPWLTRLLAAFCHKENPSFKFTSIQVNKNYASRPHVDRNNLGESLIIGLGNYTGGDLWTHEAKGNKEHTLDEDIIGAPMYKKGDAFMVRDKTSAIGGLSSMAIACTSPGPSAALASPSSTSLVNATQIHPSMFARK